MAELFGAKYAGFILSSYAITFGVIVLLVLWVWLTARSRRAQLAKLEAEGFRRNADG